MRNKKYDGIELNTHHSHNHHPNLSHHPIVSSQLWAHSQLLIITFYFHFCTKLSWLTGFLAQYYGLWVGRRNKDLIINISKNNNNLIHCLLLLLKCKDVRWGEVPVGKGPRWIDNNGEESAGVSPPSLQIQSNPPPPAFQWMNEWCLPTFQTSLHFILKMAGFISFRFMFIRNS